MYLLSGNVRTAGFLYTSFAESRRFFLAGPSCGRHDGICGSGGYGVRTPFFTYLTGDITTFFFSRSNQNGGYVTV